MKVGVIQSNYIPWRGYFDFIASVDLFVFHDDLQYTKGDWRNRNRIKTSKGVEWLTVPIHYCNVSQLICETTIDNSTQWGTKHLNKWKTEYRLAPHLDDVLELLTGINDCPDQTISELNLILIRRICEYLNISTPMRLSSELTLSGSKTDRLIELLQKLDATTYISGPSADTYLDKEAFRRHGISVEYKSYDYSPYPQLWGTFEGEVTILDLIANCGPTAATYFRSKTPNVSVIEVL